MADRILCNHGAEEAYQAAYFAAWKKLVALKNDPPAGLEVTPLVDSEHTGRFQRFDIKGLPEHFPELEALCSLSQPAQITLEDAGLLQWGKRRLTVSSTLWAIDDKGFWNDFMHWAMKPEMMVAPDIDLQHVIAAEQAPCEKGLSHLPGLGC